MACARSLALNGEDKGFYVVASRFYAATVGVAEAMLFDVFKQEYVRPWCNVRVLLSSGMTDP